MRASFIIPSRWYMGGTRSDTPVLGFLTQSLPSWSNCMKAAALRTLSSSALTSGSFPCARYYINVVSKVMSRTPAFPRCRRQSSQCHGSRFSPAPASLRGLHFRCHQAPHPQHLCMLRCWVQRWHAAQGASGYCARVSLPSPECSCIPDNASRCSSTCVVRCGSFGNGVLTAAWLPRNLWPQLLHSCHRCALAQLPSVSIWGASHFGQHRDSTFRPLDLALTQAASACLRW